MLYDGATPSVGGQSARLVLCSGVAKGTPDKKIWVRVLVALHIFLSFEGSCSARGVCGRPWQEMPHE